MLSAHLHKEWREQRLLLGASAAFLLAGALVMGLVVPDRFVPSYVEVWTVTAALALGLVGLSGDLVPGERRRGQFGLLQRTPGALRAAWTAKLLVQWSGLAVLFAVGWACGGLCQWVDGGSRAFVSAPGAVLGWIAVATGVAAPWALAVSCWLPRGVSVVPVTAIVIAVLVGPPVLVAMVYGTPVDGRTAVAALLLVAGGVLASRWSLVCDQRGAGRRRILAHGLTAAAVFAVPVWTWAGEGVWSWHHADPGDDDMYIHDAVLGTDGRTAFVTLKREWRRGPRYTLAVDLDTGSWRQLGDAGAHFFDVGPLGGSWPLIGRRVPRRWIGRRGDDEEGWSLLDGETGEVVGEFAAGEGIPRSVTQVVRARQSLLLPDGSVVVPESRMLVFEDHSGRRQVVAWPEDLRPCGRQGFGFRWRRGDSLTPRFFDLTRRRSFRVPEDAVLSSVLVRPGAWFFYERWDGEPVPESGWLWDPDSGQRRQPPLASGERIDAVAGDGRLVVVDERGGVALLDPDSGEREPLSWPGAGPLHGVRAAGVHGFRAPAWTPSGHDVFLVGLGAERRNAFARRDGTRLVPTAASPGSFRLCAIPDDDHVLVLRWELRHVHDESGAASLHWGECTLERWRFGSDEVEVLFRAGG